MQQLKLVKLGDKAHEWAGSGVLLSQDSGVSRTLVSLVSLVSLLQIQAII